MFPKLFKAWNVTHLVFEKDTDTYARERDQEVMKAARDAGVEVITKYGRTLWDSDDVVKKHGGKPTMSITQLQTAGHKVGPIPKPIPPPRSLPDPGDMPVDFEATRPDSEVDVNAQWRETEEKAYGSIAGPEGDFAIETLQELGYPAATTPHRGGETVALKMLDKIVADQPYMATFRKPRTSPAAFEPQSTTLMSPFLHFGALSVRQLYWAAQDAVVAYSKRGKKDASSPPESLTGQLLFRDMYFAAQAATGAPFSQTAHNPHCRFIPWHLPSKLDPATKLATFEYETDSAQAERWFQRWKAGTTGFPWIDALMRQLRVEGWIHHLGRHSVACFLTRGGCYIDWERGADVFEELLLDHEPACNAGNWQWLSCTAFFSQYFRCYSPISFGRKWDKNGDFIRRWVPELKSMDAKYIYEPWTAPISDQRKAGVSVQGDGLGAVREGTYPKPMFDFSERRRICLASMKQAYSIGLFGDDARVLDGSWRDLFAGSKEDLDMMDRLDSDDGENADDGDHKERVVAGKKHASSTPATKGPKQGTLDNHFKKQKT